jgi:hypothetical protein
MDDPMRQLLLAFVFAGCIQYVTSIFADGYESDAAFESLVSENWMTDFEQTPQPGIALQLDPASPLEIRGQSGEGGGSDLAAKSQNPISDLASVPLQNNFDIGLQPGTRNRYIGNLQPVIPLKLSEDWNLIARMIVPFVNAPVGLQVRSDGIGDSIVQFYFSPREPGKLIWGVGPNFLLPTSSDQMLGFQEWGAGVNAVALISEGHVVAGSLFSQIYSFGGTTKPFLIQPFFNYNLEEGWFLSVSGEFNADWELPENNRWNILLGPGIGRVFPFLGQPLNASVRFAPYIDKPLGGADWQLRVQIVMLFPK